MPVSETKVKIGLGAGAALATAIAAGYYGYDQFTKRYPRYKEQCDLLQEVGRLLAIAAGGYLIWRL